MVDKYFTDKPILPEKIYLILIGLLNNELKDTEFSQKLQDYFKLVLSDTIECSKGHLDESVSA